MNLFGFIHNKIIYLLSSPLISVSVLVILCYLLFKKPKAFIVIFLSAIAAAGILHIFSRLLDLGLEHKQIPFIEKRIEKNSIAKIDQECDLIKLSDC